MQKMRLTNSDPGQGMSEPRGTGTETVQRLLLDACAVSSVGSLRLLSYPPSVAEERDVHRLPAPNLRFPSIGVRISDGKRISEKATSKFFWGAAAFFEQLAATPSSYRSLKCDETARNFRYSGGLLDSAPNMQAGYDGQDDTRPADALFSGRPVPTDPAMGTRLPRNLCECTDLAAFGRTKARFAAPKDHYKQWIVESVVLTSSINTVSEGTRKSDYRTQ
jgi:hypothetical protein